MSVLELDGSPLCIAAGRIAGEERFYFLNGVATKRTAYS
jgi:hypothetical protein